MPERFSVPHAEYRRLVVSGVAVAVGIPVVALVLIVAEGWAVWPTLLGAGVAALALGPTYLSVLRRHRADPVSEAEPGRPWLRVIAATLRDAFAFYGAVVLVVQLWSHLG